MEWFLLSLFCAFSLATSDVFVKKALTGGSNEFTVSFIKFFFCLPPLYIMLGLNGLPDVKTGFYIAALISTPLEITSMLLYNRAIKLSPLSLTLPFLAFTPIFLLLTAYLMIGEVPNSYGLIGILLISIGGYMLNIDMAKGIFYPFKAIMKERGSVLMIIVALIYSLTSVFGKIMIDNSNFIFAPAIYFTIVTLVMGVVTKVKGASLISSPPGNNKKLHFLLGLFFSLMVISHFWAISMTKVEYMISVKRSSMLFTIIYGAIIFKEVDIKKRLFSVAVMLVGMVLIGVFGG